MEGANVKFLHAAVGGVTESDVTLAQTYGAVIIGFNVRPDSKARHLADEFAIQIRTYSVIYEALEDVGSAMDIAACEVLQSRWRNHTFQQL